MCIPVAREKVKGTVSQRVPQRAGGPVSLEVERFELRPQGAEGKVCSLGHLGVSTGGLQVGEFLDTPAPGAALGQKQGPSLPRRTFPRHVSPPLPPPCFSLRARAVTRGGAGPGELEGAGGGRGGGAGKQAPARDRP